MVKTGDLYESEGLRGFTITCSVPWPSYSKIRPDWLLQKLAYSAQTLHDESNSCVCQLDLVGGSILESHAKNRTKIGHFSWNWSVFLIVLEMRESLLIVQ